MGWQEQQAAARAAEQQRQADQRAASARQAESIRQENQSRDRANREKANADRFAAEARGNAVRRARDQAANEKAHTDRMAQIRRGGQSVGPSATPSRRAPREPVLPPVGVDAVKKKSKAGGWLLLILISGVVYAINQSGSNGSGASESRVPAPIVDGSSRSPEGAKTPVKAAEAAVTDDETPAPASAGLGSYTIALTAAMKDAPVTTEADAQNTGRLALPSSALLEPVNRPDATYPAAAWARKPVGPVIVDVSVQTDGSVIQATPETGDSLLMPAALEAAKRWTFRPYPYEPGKSVRTMRIAFPFTPPENEPLPPNSVFNPR